MIKTHLNELLDERGQTLYWLAKQSGIRYATIHQMSRGEVARLNIETLDRICDALDCQPGDLLIRVTNTKSRKRGK